MNRSLIIVATLISILAACGEPEDVRISVAESEFNGKAVSVAQAKLGKECFTISAPQKPEPKYYAWSAWREDSGKYTVNITACHTNYDLFYLCGVNKDGIVEQCTYMDWYWIEKLSQFY